MLPVENAMKLLIIGGTRFLGRAIVEAALASGHSATLFHRGRTGANLFPEAEHLLGDRDGGLGLLSGRTWDAVVDVCGYVPRIVRESVEALRASVGSYTFVSTISVYADGSKIGTDETAAVATTDDPATEEVNGETYGPLKALCERVVLDAFGDRAFVPRPGLIVGPWDPSDRFTYWPVTVAQGGAVLAPSPMEQPVQIIDARDLASWIVRMLEGGGSGVYNAVGPAERLTFGDLIESCLRVSDSQAAVEWVDHDFLLQQGVQPWTDLPLWVPPSAEEAGLEEVSIAKALAAGLTFRPLDETVRDTLAWFDSERPDGTLKAGISRERALGLLSLWRAQG